MSSDAFATIAFYTKPCPECGGAMIPHRWYSYWHGRDWHEREILHYDWSTWQCTACKMSFIMASFNVLKMRLGFGRGKPGRLGKYADEIFRRDKS